jgi:hypothetical protein
MLDKLISHFKVVNQYLNLFHKSMDAIDSSLATFLKALGENGRYIEEEININPNSAKLYPMVIESAKIHEAYAKVMESDGKTLKQRMEAYFEQLSTVYLDDDIYDHHLKSILLEQFTDLLSAFYRLDFTELSVGMIKTYDSLFYSEVPNCPPIIEEKAKLLRNNMQAVIACINFFESTLLRLSLLIWRQASDKSLNEDFAFTNAFQPTDKTRLQLGGRHRLVCTSEARQLIVWKYMRAKYFDMLLSEQVLFISSITNLKNNSNDPNEGRHSMIKMGLLDIPKTIETFNLTNPMLFDHTFISSWFIGTTESKKMWDAFIPAGESGMAIKLDYSVLLALFESTDYVITPIEISYDKQPKALVEQLDNVTPFAFKDNAFGYEQELRMLITDMSDIGHVKAGIKIPIDLKSLIHEIVFAPGTPQSEIDRYMMKFKTIGITPTVSVSRF